MKTNKIKLYLEMYANKKVLIKDYKKIEERKIKDLREFILNNRDDDSIHLKMNVSKGTVAAWKAWDTMHNQKRIRTSMSDEKLEKPQRNVESKT